ncbi:MAG TPA: hypothetical protein VH520_01670 [Streptosporangiaceae bacterium]|jgi:hypothetical protein
MNEELEEREVIQEIWAAYQQDEVVTALVGVEEIGDAIAAMRWASKLAGLRYGAEITGFDRADVSIWEPPYPQHISHFGADPAKRVLMFHPRTARS